MDKLQCSEPIKLYRCPVVYLIKPMQSRILCIPGPHVQLETGEFDNYYNLANPFGRSLSAAQAPETAPNTLREAPSSRIASMNVSVDRIADEIVWRVFGRWGRRLVKVAHTLMTNVGVAIRLAPGAAWWLHLNSYSGR